MIDESHKEPETDSLRRNSSSVAAFKKRFGLEADYVLPDDTASALKAINSKTPTIRPVVTEVPSDQDRVRWRNQFIDLPDFQDKERAARVADKLLQNLRRVPQDEFEKKLIAAYSQARNSLSGENTSGVRFIFYSGGSRKRSEEWVREIVRDYFPDDKLLEVPLIDYGKEESAAKFEIGLFMDDASYSGQRVADAINRGKKKYGMNKFLVIVPFMTKTAIKSIEKESQKLGVKTDLFVQETIPTLDEILGEEDFVWLRKVSVSYGTTKEQGLTYFAHKVPDYKSFCDYVGNTRHAEVEYYLDNLITQRPAVYHEDYLSDLNLRSRI